jgi:hypothetical protein
MGEQKKEKYSSIFDAVSKLERKKAVEKVLSEDTAEGQKAPALSNEEIVKKIEEYEKLHNVLADSLEKTFVKNNLSPKRLREYFSTSQNFSADQWQLIEKERESIEEMLIRLVPHKGKNSSDDDAKPEKTDQKRPKKMQVKSRWTPMH